MAVAAVARKQEIDNMQIEKESLPDFWTGTIVVGTSPVQFSAVEHKVRKGVYLRVGTTVADALISIGKTATEAATGFSVAIGVTSPLLYIDDLSKLWIVSNKASTPVSWIAF